MNQDPADKSDKTMRESAVKIGAGASKTELTSPSVKTTHRENATATVGAGAP